jgi:hypothetical protein
MRAEMRSHLAESRRQLRSPYEHGRRTLPPVCRSVRMASPTAAGVGRDTAGCFVTAWPAAMTHATGSGPRDQGPASRSAGRSWSGGGVGCGAVDAGGRGVPSGAVWCRGGTAKSLGFGGGSFESLTLHHMNYQPLTGQRTRNRGAGWRNRLAGSVRALLGLSCLTRQRTGNSSLRVAALDVAVRSIDVAGMG